MEVIQLAFIFWFCWSLVVTIAALSTLKDTAPWWHWLILGITSFFCWPYILGLLIGYIVYRLERIGHEINKAKFSLQRNTDDDDEEDGETVLRN